jgi:geranylgeranyl diphosphate synthase type I
MLPAIDAELRLQVERLAQPQTRLFHEMLVYHMGWKGARSDARTTGKRIRPLMLLLVCASVGGEWKRALPAAGAVEIVHNFSLVHDDVQDNSPTRRGRLTVWKKFGVPMAINVGDAFFTIANQAMLDLRKSFPAATVLRACDILQQACLDLTRGQFLDLHQQNRKELSLRAYWSMIDGKTAALVSACTQIGALLGGAGPAIERRYRDFGRLVGLAFQVQDDVLGIWGDEALTGKSAASDLAEGKLSLPVLYGLSKKARFAARWHASKNRALQAGQLRQLLQEEGAEEYTRRQARRLTDEALKALRGLRPRGRRAGAALEELTHQLLGRQS